MPLYATVLVDKSLNKPLDYQVPENLTSKISVGMKVEVPLRSSTKTATVIEIKSYTSISNPKQLIQIIQEPMNASLWKLAQWMSNYYICPLQKVLRCFSPPNQGREIQEKKSYFYSLNLSKDQAVEKIKELRNSQGELALALEKFLTNSKLEAKDLGKSLPALVRKKWVLKEEKQNLDLFEEEYFLTAPKKLNQEQSECLTKILSSDPYSIHLLHGITGSGKTEIYMRAIQATLEEGKSALMLVPEIALTSQTIERFRSRFSQKISIWHHKRSLRERLTTWKNLLSGESQLIIGARSALFCPIQNLGLILVDEEHDSSYKQSEESPCYHGRDLAVVRAWIEKARVILGSATPSLESRYNAQIGKYHYHRLSCRATSANLPKTSIVDMKVTMDKAGGFTHFCPELVSGIKDRLERGEQVLLFLNKRGYYRLQICNSCRSIVKCPHCDIGLTFHKQETILRCHLCDFQIDPPRHCPSCKNVGTLNFKGFGTEHVEKSLQGLFPTAKTLRMDRDTTKQKNSHELLYQEFKAHKADILIGTQMVAKGFHFPSVTLVGVLNADSGLMVPDFRSAEFAFQLLTQVSGRAGRSDLPGEVILQTFLPDHPVLKLSASQSYEEFYVREIEERKLFSYPPFCHLVKVVCSGEDETKVSNQIQACFNYVKANVPQGVEVLFPTPTGHAKVADKYRFQFLIKTPQISHIRPILTNLVNCKIDVDPIHTFF
jgi:primosomal protein N' (replication factor Y)